MTFSISQLFPGIETGTHLEGFGACYNPTNSPEGRWRAYSRQELLARDKASLDVFGLRDASMTDLDSLPEP